MGELGALFGWVG